MNHGVFAAVPTIDPRTDETLRMTHRWRFAAAHMIPAGLLAVLLTSITGCQKSPETGPQTAVTAPAATGGPTVEQALTWECAGGAVFTTRNLPNEDAISFGSHEGERKLLHVRSGSGAKYQEGPITFWIKGATAYYERAPAPAVDCRLRTG